jgi:uncharacterized protein
MRIVTLEEHFLLPSLVRSTGRLDIGFLPPALLDPLSDLGDKRLRDMDASGITVQVMSATLPGADLLDGDDGVRFARQVNDRLSEAVRQHPARFAGFAHLPMRSPVAAADELERAVSQLGFRGALINGTTEGLFLDDARFDPILARASVLDVPLYLHPGVPPQPVMDSYYANLPPPFGPALARGLFGWHVEVGIHVLRLALSGSFERHPGLKVIIGHMGETLPFMLDRIDHMVFDQMPMLFGKHFETPTKIILDRVYITTAGVFSTSAFLCALTSFGADRILFSVDYPYSSAVPAKRWLDSLPVSPEDRIKITHANADRLLRLSPGS